jgi:NDP-sugar pyrophosphorylase family protein
MDRQIRTADLFDFSVPYLTPLLESCEYPWEIVPKIDEYIRGLVAAGIGGFTLYAPGILVGEGVTVAPTAYIGAPAVIGPGTDIGPGAFLRRSVITGPDCTVGNSSELKNCVLMKHADVPHYNYVGDSVLGNYAHLGAGAVCSNLKSDKRQVVVHGDADYPTGLRKLGGMLGDRAEIGCHCVINPGTVVGRGTSVYPLTSLRGVIPPGCIVKSPDNIVERREQ